MPRGKIAFDESGPIPIPKPADAAAALTGALSAAAAAALTGVAGDAATGAAIVVGGAAATLAGITAYDAWSATAERTQPQPHPQKAKEPQKAAKKTCSEDWERRNLYYDEVRMGRKKSGKRSWL